MSLQVLCFVTSFGGAIGRKIFAAVVGFAVILVFRMAVLIVLRGRFFTNLYRKNAVGANIFFVVSPSMLKLCFKKTFLTRCCLFDLFDLRRSWKHGVWLSLSVSSLPES